MIGLDTFCGITVVVGGREVVPYKQNGKFILAENGKDFLLRVYNKSRQTVLAVVSLDGRNVFTGEKASVLGAGIILPAGQSIDIPGWKIDGKNAAQFYFTSDGDSYVELMGFEPFQMGVIGCAFFTQTQYRREDVYRGSRDEVTRGGSRSMGAGAGDAVAFHTKPGEFERASSTPEFVETLFFGDKQKLLGWGVVLEPKAPPQIDPFPKDNEGCLMPAGWKGRPKRTTDDGQQDTGTTPIIL